VPSFTLERLKKRSEFSVITKAGTRIVTPAFILQIYKHSSEGLPRFGLTASRKVGGAVERNRAKRRLRALIKQILPHYGQLGTDYVLIARKEVLHRNFALMTQDLQNALNQQKDVSRETS